MIHWTLVEFLILQFTPIPLVYLQIERNDKIPLVNVHRVKYEQFRNLIDKIHFLQISILPSLICQICQKLELPLLQPSNAVYHILYARH